MKEHSEPSKEEPNWVIKYNGFNDGMCPSSGVGGGPSFNEWDDKLKQLKSMKENKEEPKLQSEQKTATQILFDNGIDIMSLDDRFNSSMLQAMEEYASQFKSQLPIERKWISVEERLPDNNGPVIAYDTDSLTPVKLLYFEDGQFYYEAYGSSLCYTPQISMWMPLHEPPVKVLQKPDN